MSDSQETKQNKIYSRWIFAAVFFCVGGAAGFLLASSRLPAPVASPSFRAVREGGYDFINPLLECDAADGGFKELRPFQDKIASFVDTANAQSDNIDFVAVYFRDLNNGMWFGINETASFSPASLLKVPLMMAYYKLSESDPNLLSQTITVSNGDLQPIVPNQQTIQPQVRLEVGKTYTIEDLIDHMIMYSDNDATQLLITHIDPQRLVNIYNDFGIELPSVDPSGTQVDVKTYAGFFRILFNASYLSKDDSEKALKLLSQVSFKDGLVAGVPGNVAVAHKFGERVSSDGEDQLHDCGIVYYPDHPYLLCVMTRGNDMTELEHLVRDTSSRVYQEVDSQYAQH